MSTSLLLTPAYRELNQQLHATRPTWGTTGERWVGVLERLVRKFASTDILDYGCGKQSLRRAFGESVRGYDPAIPELAESPAPADIVICTDVLEHVEPDCLDAVLDDLRRVTRLALFLVIATRPAIHQLPDGRNAHLIQMPLGWWRTRIARRFAVLYEHNNHDLEAIFLVEPPVE